MSLSLLKVTVILLKKFFYRSQRLNPKKDRVFFSNALAFYAVKQGLKRYLKSEFLLKFLTFLVPFLG
jgi:hypothetical protein